MDGSLAGLFGGDAINVGEYAKQLLALFTIVNPLGAVPTFIALTENQPQAQRLKTARTAATTLFFVMVVAVAAGDTLLKSFGVSIPSFRVGGGVLLLLLALAMLQASPSRTKQTQEEQDEAAARESIAIVPIAIPLLAGPGAISTSIIYSDAARGLFDYAALMVNALLIALASYLFLALAEPVGRWLGRTGINVVTRIMGMILAALAVEFITRGLTELLPGLAR